MKNINEVIYNESILEDYIYAMNINKAITNVTFSYESARVAPLATLLSI